MELIWLVVIAAIAVMFVNSFLNKRFEAYNNATRQGKAVIIFILFIVLVFIGPSIAPIVMIIVGLALLFKFIKFFIR